MNIKIIGVLALFLVSFSTTAIAAVPSTISYQGYLTDTNGVAANGDYSVTFKLYDSGSIELWSETLTVTVTNGVFEATLGAVTDLPDPLLTGSSLGISLGSNPEMTPRQNLNSTPFAIHAKTTEKDTLNSLACTVNQSVRWSGSEWECSDVGSGGVDSITTGAGLTSSGADVVDISITDGGISANKIGSGQVVKGINVSGNLLTDNVSLTAGNGVSFSTAGNVIGINTTLSGPSSVSTVSGLTGGGSSGDITVGIADGGVVSTHIAGGEVVKQITVGETSINDAVSLVGGEGVSISSSANEVTFSASAPTNMVTTDTEQTISGEKTFNQPIEVSGLKGDVVVGSLGNFERLEVFGELRLTNHNTGTRYLEVETNSEGDTEINNPTSGGDIYITDDLFVQIPGQTSYKDLTAGDLEIDDIEVYGGSIDLRRRRSDGGDSGGRISFNSNYGIELNPHSNFGDTVNVTDNLRVGDDIIATDNVFIDNNLEVSGLAFKTGGGQWATLSDRRLKKNISSMDGSDALEKINTLKPVEFDWINPKEHGGRSRVYGFIAQEVEESFPEWVGETSTNGKDVDLVSGLAKSVDLPNDFNAYLISAIKELKLRNELLKKMVCEDRAEHELCK